MSVSIDPTLKAKKQLLDKLKEPASYLKIATVMLLCVTCVLLEGYVFTMVERANTTSFQHFLVLCGPAGVAVIGSLLLYRCLDEPRSSGLETSLLVEWGAFCVLAGFCVLIGNAYSAGLQAAYTPKYIASSCFFGAGILMIVDASCFSKGEGDRTASTK